MDDEKAYVPPLWREVDGTDPDMSAAIERINCAAAKHKNSSSQASRLESVLMYLDAVEKMIRPCEGISPNSKAFMREFRRSVIALQRGYIPDQLKPLGLKRHRFDYNEWNRRALLRYCYDVLRECGFNKKQALTKLENLAKECAVKLPLGELDQAIINNFSYKLAEDDFDKNEAIELYRRMREEFMRLWRQLNLSKEQALVWCQRTLTNGAAFPEIGEGHGWSVLYERGNDGTLVPCEPEPSAH